MLIWPGIEKIFLPCSLPIRAVINDPDASDVIGNVQVIVNGGIVAAHKEITTNSATVEFSIPNNYSFYYLKVTEKDGNIAVTAPVWSGKVEACIDGKKEIFYQGEMFIINSHSVHQFNFPEFTHLYTYLLSVDIFKEFQIQSYFFKLKAPSNKEWFKPWLEMKYIHHLLPIEQHILMYQLYQKLIQDCLLDKKQEENTKEIYKIIEEIEKRYNQDLTLEIIAEQFHFHPNSLTRYFKKQTGTTFYQYLQKIRLKHAYYDLIHTNMKIIDIALNHGFKNVKSFENVFKKEYHTTPTKYRKVNN